MVKNINSAFGRGLQDTRDMGRRPLLSEPPRTEDDGRGSRAESSL